MSRHTVQRLERRMASDHTWAQEGVIRLSPIEVAAGLVPGGFAMAAWLLYFVPGLAGAYGPFVDWPEWRQFE